MKIGICGDVHWSQYSSIVRKHSDKHSVRLTNLIQSINWFNELTSTLNTDFNVFMGDFFDKSELNAAEISALEDIKWYDKDSYFICGNHEMMSVDHGYSSAKIFSLLPSCKRVITSPYVIKSNNLEIHMLPYVLESNRRPISDYFDFSSNSKKLLLSHNDLRGIHMGKFISEAGFSIDEIEANYDLCINGHLHNGSAVTSKVLNIGNLTGQNFSEDAFKYRHNVFILDTDTLSFEIYENPFALNFYKIDADTYFKKTLSDACTSKGYAVCTIKCKNKYVNDVRAFIDNNENIIESRVLIEPDVTEELTEQYDIKADYSVDHLSVFNTYVLEKFENCKELREELMEVLS